MRWRREDMHWCTGGRRFNTRTRGAIIQYLGGGHWNPVAWWYSREVKSWPNTKDIGKAMRAVERWLKRRRAAPRRRS